ncbi:MAG: calcium/sodium antiporter [Anaerovoracaceae bacterium]
MSYILLIAGFYLLVKGADVFVGGSVAIAERFRIPSFIIGLTIVAMGTSAPEAAVSITAALAGQNDIATGNVIGSNIFNTLVVLGACAAIKPINVESSMLKKDFSLNLFYAFLMLFLTFNIFSGAGGYTYSRADGIIFLVFFTGYMLITVLPETKKDRTSEQASGSSLDAPIPAVSVHIALLKIAFGLAGIIVGGNFVVHSASAIAASFGVSANLIGLTIVAMGTSLPELVTSIVAALRGESDMAVGNVIGSNMFNILFVLGLSSTIHPITVNPVSITDLIILIAVSVITTIFCKTGGRLNKPEGIVLLMIYAAYMLFIISR